MKKKATTKKTPKKPQQEQKKPPYVCFLQNELTLGTPSHASYMAWETKFKN